MKRGFDVFESFFCTLDDSCFMNSNSPLVQTPQQTSPKQEQSSSKNAVAPSTYHQMDEKLIYICYIMRFLYDTAIDSFDKFVKFSRINLFFFILNIFDYS